MASEPITTKLRELVDEVLSLDKDSLRTREAWGTLNFEDAEADLKRVFTIIAHLKTLPLEYLPEDTANQIHSQVQSALTPLKNLDEFSLDLDNPKPLRQQRAAAIATTADTLYKSVTPWIPFLAYQKGDIAKNISSLSRAVTDGRELVEKAKLDIESRNSEMDEIIEKTREASASAGAAVFTKAFDDDSTTQSNAAGKWLIATLSLAGASLAAAVGAIVLNSYHESTTIIDAGPRFFAFALLLTATLWTGRMYKAFMHQSAASRHRALALQTFQAFSAAASDDQTKNAVLLEATHSIFGNSTSGFLDTRTSNDPGTRVLEIMKSTTTSKQG